MAKTDGPLSATYLNPIIDDLREWVIEQREMLLREFYASGYPPGTKPSSPDEIYQRLVSLMQAGSPVYWQSQEAQDELDKLSERFGAPPPLQPPPQQPMQSSGMM